MTKASDNAFPSVLITEGTEPSAPAAGKQRVYIDSSTHHLKRTDSGGVDIDLETNQSTVTLTLPTFVAIGSSATGTGDITPGLPTGHTTNDILLLFVQTDSQAATPPAGYAQLGPAVGIGAAAAASSTRGYVFWKRDGGAEGAPTVTDSGDHTLGIIMAIRGCMTTGDPFLSIGQTRKATASTTGTAAAGATPTDACLVVNAFFHGLDSASVVFSAWTNASLASITEQIDVATADGNGGGIGVATGGMTKSGSFGSTTVTETSTTDVSTTFIMLPAGIAARNGFIDQQVFLTPGLADTWTKPTAAVIAQMSAIGGGASGSAGRNAATASGGGGGGGGMFTRAIIAAPTLPATMTVTAGAGGAASTNSDGAASNGGNVSTVVASAVTIVTSPAGLAATAAASGTGGTGGVGGGRFSSSPTAAGSGSFTVQATAGGVAGTGAGQPGIGDSGGSGGGGGTTGAGAAGGAANFGGGGGGGGRSNTNVGTGGGSMLGAAFSGATPGVAGGATASANGGDSPYPDQYGGAGAAGGGSVSGLGGRGGWPGGGGGGGGSQSGAVAGGAGGDGVVVITTFIG